MFYNFLSLNFKTIFKTLIVLNYKTMKETYISEENKMIFRVLNLG